MFHWARYTPLFTTIFSFRKRVDWKDKQSSDIRIFYSNKLKNIFRQQKNGTGLDDANESKWPISLKPIWLVCFKLIWSCKHRIWYCHFWFRKCVKSIWSNKFDRALAALSNIHSTRPTHTLHILYGHPSGIPLLILNLKTLTVSDRFI